MSDPKPKLGSDTGLTPTPLNADEQFSSPELVTALLSIDIESAVNGTDDHVILLRQEFIGGTRSYE